MKNIKMNRRVLRLIAMAIVLIVASGYKFFAGSKAELTTKNAEGELKGPYKVERVVDGDTYIINIEGKQEKIRALGIDTPESVAVDENAYKNCPEGEEASRYVDELIGGKNVIIEYDARERDRFGRTLAYIYIDGNQLEEILLTKGYARTMTIPPNIRYADKYKRMQKEARDNKEGFWVSNPYK